MIFLPARLLACLLGFVFLGSALPPASAQQSDGLPRDEQKNRWFHWEITPTSPLVCTSDGSKLFAANAPGGRIAVVDVETREIRNEIPVGQGTVALALHPGGTELWVVDGVAAVVSVIDVSSERVMRTIAVGAGAAGIAFHPSGDRAYVSCARAQSVDVVRTLDYALVQSIAIPAREPRALVCDGEVVRVVAFQSGNNTAPRGDPSGLWNESIFDVRRVSDFPGTQSLPDRDLLTILVSPVPGSDLLDLSQTTQALGTTLYNLHARPGSSELWIPNTDALNSKFVGERNFKQGRMVVNQLTIVAQSGTRYVNLDQLTAVPSQRCGTPSSVAFNSQGTLALVSGYGSDSICVLRLNGAQVSFDGTLRLTPSSPYPDGAGPRVLLVTPDDQTLVSWNKGDNSITFWGLANLPTTPGYDLNLPAAKALGFDPLPANIRQGRIHFRRTQNSLSGTSSCDSCHVDGNSDGLAWDLSSFLDAEGTPRSKLRLPLDRKGPMVTSSVRSLRELAPYHWRGERKKLTDFNIVFTDMLERHQDGELSDLGGKMIYISQYMDALAVGPNPHQASDRSYRAGELAGANLFQGKPVLGSLTCADCHPLPLTTHGEFAPNHLGGFAAVTKVPSLRAVESKLSPPYVIGQAFGERTELGAGLNHAGNASSLAHVMLAELPPPQQGQVFALDAVEAAQVEEFLRALDTGIAPAAVFQATAHAENAASFATQELAYLRTQAQAGNCDLVYRYGPISWRGKSVYAGGLYDAVQDRFQPASKSLPLVSSEELLALATNGTPVTFLGVPPWAGPPHGIDRDNDQLYDLDELTAGTNPEAEDSDDDGFPDGYEILWGMNPLVAENHSPDNVAPSLLGSVRLVWTSARAVKVEFQTSELVRALFSYDGGYPLLRWPLFPSFDDHFSVVLNELEPGRETQVTIRLTDPEGNATEVLVPVRTSDLVLPRLVGIADISYEFENDAQGGNDLRLRVSLARGAQAPALGYNVRGALYYQAQDQAPTLVRNLQTWLIRNDGVVEWRVDVPANIAPGGGDFVFAILGIDAPPSRPMHARGEDQVQRIQIPY